LEKVEQHDVGLPDGCSVFGREELDIYCDWEIFAAEVSN
jgi:hypothetical protein